MELDSFGRLSRRVAAGPTVVRGAQSLLNYAREVVSCEAAVLLALNEAGRPGECVEALGLALPEPASAVLGALTSWYASQPRERSIDGYRYEGETPLVAGDVSFEAAVVGLGKRYHLLVLRSQVPCDARGDALYESYHAWALAALVRGFEASEAEQNLKNAEWFAAQQKPLQELRERLLRQYQNDWGNLVREETSWATIREVLANQDSELVGLCACEYLGHQNRLAWAYKDRKNCESVPSGGRDDSAQPVRLKEEAYREAIRHLAEPKQLVSGSPELFQALDPERRRKLPEDCASIPSPRARLERITLVVLEHGWRLVLKGAERRGLEGETPSKEIISDIRRIVFQDEQPVTPSDAEGDRGAKDGLGDQNKKSEGKATELEELRTSAQTLLSLSIRLLGGRIEAGWDESLAGQSLSEREARRKEAAGAKSGGEAPPAAAGADASKVDSQAWLLVGRSVLWTYLGYLLAKSERLTATYLQPGDEEANPIGRLSDHEEKPQETRPHHPPAPNEASREYLKKLATFFLGLVELLERYYNMDTRTRTVSPAELVDALLYLVDRYAHVELQVPEWLALRHHLARAMPAELEHHLESSYYRDHLLHVIDVFLFGHLLLNTTVPWTDKASTRGHLVEKLANTVAECSGGKAAEGFDWSNPQAYLRNWAVAALLHDIGYQLIHRGSVNQEPEPWATFFDLDMTAPRSVLAYEKQDRNNGEAPKRHLRRMLEHLHQVGESATWLPLLLSSAEDKRLDDHGVLSSLRLAQLLAAMDQGEPGSHGRSAVDVSYLSQFGPALHAILHHNLQGARVSAATHPLSCLLRLCDELQEWNRYRVNIEKMVKQLYVAFEVEPSVAFDKRRLVSQLEVNLKAKLEVPEVSKGAGGTPLRSATSDQLVFEVSPQKDQPERHDRSFWFKLRYEAPKDADYDPILTLLNKAYNLQHLDLGQGRSGDRCQRWRLELGFPNPDGNGVASEYDVYCEFAEKHARWLPMLPITPCAKKAPTGLSRLALPPDGDPKLNYFVILADGKPSAGERSGWLTSDPGTLTKRLTGFREKKAAGK